MKPFHHINGKSIARAVDQLNKYEGRASILAGGTDLLGVLKDQILPVYPEALINIKTIPGLDYIREDSSGLKIGSLVRLSDLANSPLVKKKYKILADAAHSIGTPQIRNMGTVGGNLCQDTRCWYYRYPHAIGYMIPCFRKGNGSCPAIKGDHRYHSVFGGKGCIAVSPSDLATVLMALNGEIITAGVNGGRSIPIGDFYNPQGKAALEHGEVVREIRVPQAPEKAQQHYLRFTLRKPVDFAVVSVAVVVSTEQGICSACCIVLGAVAPRPLRADEAEQYLIGKRVEPITVETTAGLALKNAKPLPMNGYKIEIGKTLVARALYNNI